MEVDKDAIFKGASKQALELMKKFESKTAKIGIVGLGYVGLPLSKALLENGYSVIGFDVDQRKIDAIGEGRSYIKHLGDDFFEMIQKSDKFHATIEKSDLREADAILLCVPTPLGKHVITTHMQSSDLWFRHSESRLILKRKTSPLSH